MPDLQRTLTKAQAVYPQYQQAIEDLPWTPRGVSYGDMLFAHAVIEDLSPPKIVESGRAQGQSTLILSILYPDTPIISVERKPDHPDEKIALERLKNRKNVDCRYGDARKVLPKVVGHGDAVMIDGPKGFRALKLIYRLLKHNGPSVAFLHDCGRGTAIRDYIERHCPGAFFADDPRFLERYGALDEARSSPPPTLGCIPPRVGFPGAMDQIDILIARQLNLLRTRGNR